MSKDWQSQARVKWDCKYHVVMLPKYRKKVLFGKLRRQIGAILRDLCRIPAQPGMPNGEGPSLKQVIVVLRTFGLFDQSGRDGPPVHVRDS